MYLLKSNKSWIVAALLVLTLPGMAFSQLTLDGQVRPRTEYRNGYRMLNADNANPAFFTSQRTRLSLNYKTDLYEIGLSGQDVRVWGDVGQLQANPNVNIHEAWAQLNVSDRVGVKLGRQELVYGTQRLLGSVNWTQQARSHDALILKYATPDTDFRLDIGGAYNQQGEKISGNSYTLNNYKVLSYIWLNKQFGDLRVSAIGLTDGFEQPAGATNFRYTYGTHLNYGKNVWKLNASLYFQSGDDASRRNIAAQMYAVSTTYNANPLQITLGYDHLSGGEAGDANPARHSFNTLYATNHKFYGNMDYFLNIPVDTRGGGLQDLHLQAAYTLGEHSSMALTYHHFDLSGSITDPVTPTQTLDKSLGSEFDFNISHIFSPEVALKVGYSVLSSSESLEHLQQNNTGQLQHWGWVMLAFTPEFID